MPHLPQTLSAYQLPDPELANPELTDPSPRGVRTRACSVETRLDAWPLTFPASPNKRRRKADAAACCHKRARAIP
jgi:hypothetical protein